MKINNFLKVLIMLFVLIMIWSVIRPLDMFTWFLEVFPALFGFIILVLTGYIWDTQSDMLFALIGSVVGLNIFYSFHDKAILKMESE